MGIGTGGVAKVHESKFHETLLSVSGYFRMKFVSPVCAEGTTPFSAAWQRLKNSPAKKCQVEI